MLMCWSVPFIRLISPLTLSDSIALPNANQPIGGLTESHVVSIPCFSSGFISHSFERTSSCPRTCAGRADRIDIGVYYLSILSPSQESTEVQKECSGALPMASIL